MLQRAYRPLQQLWQLARRRRKQTIILLLALAAAGLLYSWRAAQAAEDVSHSARKVPAPHSVSSEPQKHPPSGHRSLVLQKLPQIPRIIHHYFHNAVEVPESQAQAVTSWANNHKNFTTYLWDSRYFEAQFLPKLRLSEQTQRCYRAERHTVARLLLLQNQGGLLVDSDLMSLRSLVSYLEGSTCIVAQEPQEAAALMYGLNSLPSLRFAACRTEHPFLHHLLEQFCTRVLSRRGQQPSKAAAVAADISDAFEAAIAAYDDACTRKEGVDQRPCDYRDRVVLADAGVFLPMERTGMLRERLVAICASAEGDNLERRACQSLSDPADSSSLLSAASLARRLPPASAEERKTRLNAIAPGRRMVRNLALN